MFDLIFDRRMLMADSGGQGGYPVANTGNYTNAYTGDVVAFDSNNTMAPQIKQWYNTRALENARSNHIFAQFADNEPLPEKHGMTVEKRKPNTFGDVERLTEGVIPEGKKFGYSAITMQVYEYGQYTPIGRRLMRHAVDPVAQDAAEEMGASGGNTQDKIARDVCMTGSNVMYCSKWSGSTENAVTSRSALDKTAVLNPTMVNRAATWLKKHKAPKINGKYVAIIHPSVSYDIRQSADWIDAHKYATPENIYNGEIGELHGVRFVESDNAKVLWGKDLASNSRTLLVNGAISQAGKTITFDGGTVAEDALIGRKILVGTVLCEVTDNTANTITVKDNVNNIADNTVIYPGEGGAGGIAVYPCIFLGAKAFAMIDVAGGSMEIITKSAEQAGGPLNQFATVGVYFETGGGIQYEERVLRVECGSHYSDVDEDPDA
ncbi:MAG: N4-gp56 family major capsid protein [Clostridia bacterium]|nr:N4-gp56 family major capsid protein [Clostridia bacterium]MBR4537258.1 N4-gp56 family major capsid protein [Clostridia bacterium]MBR4540511.1 N4-gp56 family major capsid protein [Clostridia bacterium]